MLFKFLGMLLLCQTSSPFVIEGTQSGNDVNRPHRLKRRLKWPFSVDDVLSHGH
jgi:hypothetical protein